jgi:hypothetical protein
MSGYSRTDTRGLGDLQAGENKNQQKRMLTASALLEGKSNLMRMRQEIPLSEAEVAALDDGVCALESLLARLSKVPTPVA